MNEPRTFLDGRVTLFADDCREVLRDMEDNSVDSVVTDPPYGIKFMNRKWDDNIAFQTELWAEVLRVLKPGGYALIFGGTRTAHRMVCAIEDAGFEIRDEVLLDKDSGTEYSAFEESLSDEQRRQFGKLFRERGTGRLSWQFGVGFPKSKNISASIDRCLCVLPLATSISVSGIARAVLQQNMLRNGETQNANLQSLREDMGTEDSQTRSERENLHQGMRKQTDLNPSQRAPIKALSESDGCVRGMRKAEDGISVVDKRRDEPGMLQALQWSPAGSGMGETRLQRICGQEDEARHVDGKESCMEGGRNAEKAARKLHRSSLRQGAGMGAANGAEGSIYHGASVGNGSDVRVSSDQNGGRQSRGSQSSEQPPEQLDAISDECGSQARGSWPICGRCCKPIIPEGLGTALKPAHEPICMARKPFERGLNGAQNVMKWGVGAINVGACRVGTNGGTYGCSAGPSNGILGDGLNGSFGTPIYGLGRWPANLIHDGSDEVLACFPETGVSPPVGSMGGGSNKHSIYGDFAGERHENGHGDSGSAARFFASFPQDAVQYVPNGKNAVYGRNMGGDYHPGFKDSGSDARLFYTSKADSDDRLGSKHPTVKPIDLIQYLVRLITPKNGVCLDLFAGTGTTAEACFREGFRAILIEREAEYIKDIERRMSLVMEGPVTRANAGMKARGRPRDDGPLFGDAAE